MGEGKTGEVMHRTGQDERTVGAPEDADRSDL
jgi:hypothetical protein